MGLVNKTDSFVGVQQGFQ